MKNIERINWMKERLTNAFQPTLLIIEDESERHIGHEGAKSGAGHFSLHISSACFEGQPLLTCHRMIYGVLGEAIPLEIHALKINVNG